MTKQRKEIMKVNKKKQQQNTFFVCAERNRLLFYLLAIKNTVNAMIDFIIDLLD